MNSPKISIIVPCFNNENTISRCLKSICNQTFIDYEAIVIDDGSTDTSGKIIDCFSKMNAKIISVHQKNYGLSYSRELGFGMAKGKYVCTLDADDYYDSNFLSEMIKEADLKNSDIVICERFIIDKNKINVDGIQQISIKHHASFSDYYSKTVKIYKMGDSWDKIYKKTFIQKSNIHFCLPPRSRGNDYLFNHSLLFFHPSISAVYKPLIYHDISFHSLTRSYSINYLDGYYLIFKKLINLASTNEMLDNLLLDCFYYDFSDLIIFSYLDLFLYCRKKRYCYIIKHTSKVLEIQKDLDFNLNNHSNSRFEKLLIMFITKKRYLGLFILSCLYRIKKYDKFKK